ncbi:MAG: hypothetical protein QXZ17_16185, partial [Nitrososphaerota archaeon]
LLDEPIILLILPIAIGIAICYYFYRFGFPIDKRKIHSLSRNASLLSFIAFWIFFVLGWEGIVPFLYNWNVFRITGAVTAISFLLTMITYDW